MQKKGRLFFQQNIFEKALAYDKQALYHFRNLPDSARYVMNTYESLAINYNFLGKRDTSLLFYRKALDIACKQGDSFTMGRIHRMIASASLSKREAPDYMRKVHSALKLPYSAEDYAFLSVLHLQLDHPDSAKIYSEKVLLHYGGNCPPDKRIGVYK